MNSLICKTGQTTSLSNMVNSYLLYTYQEDSGKYLPSYLKFALDIYSDLQFHVLSTEIKKIYTIDTKLNTVKLPDDCLYWLQVEAVRECKKADGTIKEELIPLLENDNRNFPYIEEIVAKQGCPNPKCKSDICSDVKSITAVSEVVSIDGTDYTNVTKTQLFPDGSMIREICKWYYTGVEVSDYTAPAQDADNDIVSIKINDIDYTIINFPSNLQEQLNGLNLGTFIVTESEGGFVSIVSYNNPNHVQSLHRLSMIGPPIDVAFVESNTHINVVQHCNTEQLCKLELDEESCVVNTPDNVALIKNCCTCLDTCCHTKHDLSLPTINVHDGVIYFSNNHYPKILLTYKTSGINFAQETMIPTIAEQAMIAGLAFNAMKYKKNVSSTEKEMARAYYNIEKNKLVKVMFPLRIQELINVAHGRPPIL